MGEKLERIQKMITGEVARPPVAQLIDYHVTEAEEGRVVIELQVSERLHNAMGTLHGGIFGDIADAAMGFAFATTLEDDKLHATVEMKLNLLKPVFDSTLRAEGKVIKRGSRLGLMDCHIYDEKNSLVAHATSTCMVLDGSSTGKRERKE